MLRTTSMKIASRLSAAFFAACLLTTPAWSSDDDFESDPEWSDDDWFGIEEVNEGELEFLAEPPAELVHHHENVMTLGPTSLEDGWVRLDQCHRNIDKVGRAQIIFRAERIRNLRITESTNIGSVWVEDASVQLSDIGEDSMLCLSAESFALSANGDGSYEIDNGPFMRRFLDGYYPMRVSQKIMLADSGLEFFGIHPEIQPGFDVRVTNVSIDFDAWFEGRLLTEVKLVPENWSAR